MKTALNYSYDIHDFILSVDLGQAADYTAVAVMERIVKMEAPAVELYQKADLEKRKPFYHLRYLHRYPLQTKYPDIVKDIESKLAELPAHLVVDWTGVGRAVVDAFREKGLQVIPISITGGNKPGRLQGGVTVPKRELVSTTAVLLQSKRLEIAKGIELKDVLIREMQTFKAKINTKTGHDSYEAWREGDHDDLVLAVALAGYAGERLLLSGKTRKSSTSLLGKAI